MLDEKKMPSSKSEQTQTYNMQVLGFFFMFSIS